MNTRTNKETKRSGDFIQRWGLLVVMAMVAWAAWAYLFASFAEQKRALLEERRRELSELNSAVAQHTAGVLKLAETNLRTLDAYLQTHPTIDPRTDAHFVALTDMLRRASNGLIQLRVVSTDGKLYYIPSLDGKPLADVKDRKYYTEQIAPAERKLYFGDPVMSRVTHKWGLPISWRVESPVSGMLVILAAVELDGLYVLHEKMRLKPAGTITLINTNGTVISRTPYEQSLQGRNVASGVNFKAEYGVKPRGSFISSSALSDGVARVASYERLEEYPVIVLVTEGLNEVLAPYYRHRNVTFALCAIVTLLLSILTYYMQRFLRALHAAREELKRLATTDSLTGILARRAFLEIAQREFSRAHRYERPTMVLALDLDHFKKVNDTHGHAAGDTVLRKCCAAWLTVLREQDYLGRIGGEEFCAVLPETGIEGAFNVASRLREVTSNLRFQGVDGEFSVTVSIGLSAITFVDDELAQVMERADKALYSAKKHGRNRVVASEQARLRAVATQSAG